MNHDPGDIQETTTLGSHAALIRGFTQTAEILTENPGDDHAAVLVEMACDCLLAAANQARIEPYLAGDKIAEGKNAEPYLAAALAVGVIAGGPKWATPPGLTIPDLDEHLREMTRRRGA